MIHWGFIGCGAVTEKKSGSAFSKAAGSDVVAVMCRQRKRAEDFARRHGGGETRLCGKADGCFLPGVP